MKGFIFYTYLREGTCGHVNMEEVQFVAFVVFQLRRQGAPELRQ